MGTPRYNQTPEQMKPWQKGFDIKEIEDYRSTFDCSYNKFARGPFSTWNNPKVADSLSKQRIVELCECYYENLGGGKNGKLLYCENVPCPGYIDTHIAKTSTDIVMYFDVVIGRKLRGDRIINAIAYSQGVSEAPDIAAFISRINEWREPIWFYIWEEDPVQKEIALGAGFKKIGVKISSFSEVYGIYFRDGDNETPTRKHPVVDQAELACMLQLKTLPDFKALAEAMGDRIRELDGEFANHYSKYNKSKAWGALSIRGYSSEITMIEKPSCMNEAWQKEHENDNLVLQDTELRKKFPELEKILRDFPSTNFDRIRLMRLQPGGGELSRHVDHVEGDSGISDGRIMRFHIPIITNPKVLFTMWNTNGEKVEQTMKQGEAWLFDFRKPHMAVNGGDDIRIHLVIDVVMDEKFRKLIRENLCN